MDLLFTEEQVAQAVANPPADTRAYFRGTCVAKFVDQVAAASWDSVILDLGPDVPLKRISTPDALGGTQFALQTCLIAQSLRHQICWLT
jgi:Pup amidohydrolase